MKEKNTKKISVGSALLIAVMSLGSFSAFSSLTGKNLSSFVPTVFADDNNDEEQGKDEP